jgi:hypothetical protein
MALTDKDWEDIRRELAEAGQSDHADFVRRKLVKIIRQIDRATDRGERMKQAAKDLVDTILNAVS